MRWGLTGSARRKPWALPALVAHVLEAGLAHNVKKAQEDTEAAESEAEELLEGMKEAEGEEPLAN